MNAQKLLEKIKDMPKTAEIEIQIAVPISDTASRIITSPVVYACYSSDKVVLVGMEGIEDE